MTPHRLRVNVLVQFALALSEGEDPKAEPARNDTVERVLYLDPTRTYVEMIDVDSKKAWNHQRRCEDVLAALECGDAVILPHDYKLRRITADELNQRARAKKRNPVAIARAVETRDSAWLLMGDLVTLHVPDIFDPKRRGELVRGVLARTGRKDKSKIYDCIRRFWQGGMVKDALLGDYRLCGSRKQTDTGAKRGPKSSGLSSPGIARTQIVKDALAAGVHRFLKGTGKGHVQAAHDETIRAFFYREEKDPITGTLVRVLLPPSQRPSLRQFRTQIAEERTKAPVSVTKGQLGEREYNRNARATVGSTEDLAWGAGTLYMGDWTVLPFSVLNPYRLSESVGYPTGYAFIDFSTWLVAGVSVTLERGSWLGGMEAFEIAITEKVSFCREFGYPLAGPWAWPADIAPDQFFADGGEYKTYNSDAITNGFHTTLANEPPYRPDLKSLVEAYFAMVKNEMFWTLPGVAPRDRRRGDRDPRLDAVLTMRLATWVMIDFAVWHNSNFIIPEERMPAAALEDGVKRHPLDLWHWSIRNESGSGREYDREHVQKQLLPTARAKVDGHGMWVDGLPYTCERAEREEWFDKAAATGPWYVDVAREQNESIPQSTCGASGGRAEGADR